MAYDTENSTYLPIFKVKSNLGLPEKINVIVDELVGSKLSSNMTIIFVQIQVHHEMSRMVFFDLLDRLSGDA